MSRFVRVLAAACCSALVSSSQAQDADKVTYVDHVAPLLKARCGSCHNANDKKGGLIVDSFAGIMTGGSSGTVLEGGSPDASYLWQLVNHESEPKMPPNADKLPEAELAVIKKWIEGGVLETSGSTAMIKKTSSVAKIEVTTARPADIAMPQKYFGDPVVVAPRPNAVTALSVSPWASLAAVSGHHQIALFNTATLEPLGVLPFPEGQPQILKFSRNGSLLLAGGGRGGASGKVILFDVKTGSRVAEIGDEYDSILAADISPDQSQVALGGPKKMLRVYNVATGELMYENKKHTDWVTAIEFSPDGVLLASGDRSNGLVVWEAFTGRPFHDLLGHTAAINDISWRGDSNLVASGSEDGSVRLWEMNNGTQVKTWNAHGAISSIEFVRDGRMVSTGRDRIVRLWNADGGQIAEFGGMTDIGMDVAFDAETERVLGGDWAGVVRVWKVEGAALVGQFDTNPPTIAAHITNIQAQVAAAQAAAQASAAQVAAIVKAQADKQAVADAAVAAMNAANAKVTQTTTIKTEAEKGVVDKTAAKVVADKAATDTATAKTAADTLAAEKTAAFKAAEEALKAAQIAYDAALKEQQAAVAAATAAATAATDVTTMLTAAQTAANAAIEAEKVAAAEAAAAKVAADKAVAEAVPTPEAQKALQDAQAAAAAAQAQVDAINASLQRLQAAVAPPATAAAPAATPAPQ